VTKPLEARDTGRAMAQENVEIVRRAYEAFNRRDLVGATAVFERDAEWVPYLAALEEEIYRGRDAIEEMWREILRHVPDFRIDFVGVVADSSDVAVVEVEFRGTGKASGADIRTSVFQAGSFRDGKVARVQGFRSAAEALEAVGLRE
jgi:ketosteroid isomerase-like protein